jgi:hypothetical protein
MKELWELQRLTVGTQGNPKPMQDAAQQFCLHFPNGVHDCKHAPALLYNMLEERRALRPHHLGHVV